MRGNMAGHGSQNITNITILVVYLRPSQLNIILWPKGHHIFPRRETLSIRPEVTTSVPPESAHPPLPPWKRQLAMILATGGKVGFIPWAPGTLGAALGLPLAWVIGWMPWYWQTPAIVAVCAAGIPVCTIAARSLGNVKDPGCIVLDEIASLPITFFLVPMDSWLVVAVGFGLHRLFDITKPPPARPLERLPEGLGIMADDWAAGVYSNLALHALRSLGWL